MMLLSSPTYAQFSRPSPSSASPRLSHYTKTSGRATLGAWRASMDAGACRLRPARARRERRGMAAWRVRWRTLGGQTRAWPCGYQKLAAATMACVSVATSSSGCRVTQHVLPGWRHVRSEASRGDRISTQRFLQDAILPSLHEFEYNGPTPRPCSICPPTFPLRCRPSNPCGLLDALLSKAHWPRTFRPRGVAGPGARTARLVVGICGKCMGCGNGTVSRMPESCSTNLIL